MNVNTQKLHDLGQSLWVDNISRDMLAGGTLARYIADRDRADVEAVLDEFRREGIDEALAARLQQEGAEAFATSWHALLARIHEKSAALVGSGA